MPQAFVWMDRYLDTTRHGPMFLRQPEIAKIVMESLHRGAELGHYELGRWVIMANHVHVLLLPRISPPRLLCTLKGRQPARPTASRAVRASLSGKGIL